MKEKVKDILRTHVDKHEYPVDPAEIWAGLQTEIEGDNQKDKKRFFAIFFGFAAIVLIGLLAINLGQDNINPISDLTIQKEGESQIESLTMTGANNQKEDKENERQIENKSNADTQKEELKNSDSVSQVELVKINANDLTVISNDLENSEVGIFEAQSFQELKTNVNKSSNNNSKNNSESSVSSRTLLSFGSIVQLNSESLENQSKGSDDSEYFKFKLVKRPSFEDLEVIEFIGNNMISGIKRNQLMIGSENLSKFDVTKVRSQRNTVSVLAGAGVFTKNIVAFDESHIAYANGRESYEKPLELISAQALISIPLISKLTLSTGIQYLQFNESLEWQGSYFVNGNGDIFPAPVENLVGENYYQEINYSLLNYNQSRLFSVPVLVGYTVRKQRLTYGVKAGVNFQLQTQTIGKVFNEDLIPINTLNHKFGLGIQSKFEIGYFLVPGLELFSELSVLQVDSIEDIVTQRFRSYSLGLGLRQSL